MFHVSDFVEKFFGQDRNVRFFQPGGIENVDHLIGDECSVDNLANRCFQLFIGATAAAAIEPDQSCFDSLEEGDLIFDIQRFFVGTAMANAVRGPLLD